MRRWNDLPIGRVVRLVGASSSALALALEPLPGTAPAVVTWRPRIAPSQAAVVSAVLDELETVAIGLFPAWLPDAEAISERGGAAVPAVRALALRLASTTSHFGPYLADLAERALRDDDGRSRRFSPEVRSVGVARVVAASFSRPATALLVEVTEEFDDDGEHVLVRALEWLADRGGFGVWLTGVPLATVDWLTTVPVCLPGDVTSLDRAAPPIGEPVRPAVWYPPLAGRPHPGSWAEQALESALSQRPWAAGRVWNQPHQSHPLANPVRLDLVWWRERCVVEVDGPEHRDALRFEADRRRDVQLQLDGYAVLRFTNRQILHDVDVVVSQIERFITARRLDIPEGHPHVR